MSTRGRMGHTGHMFSLSPRPARRSPLALAALLLAALAGCGEPPPAVTKAGPGPVPASEQREGDPEAGYRVVVGGEYVTCGMPYTAWRRANAGADDGPRLPGREGRNAELPYYLSAHSNPDGVELVVTNCLLCHGGVFEGEPVVGLGDETLDFTGDPRQAVDAVGSYVSGAAETAAWRKWAGRVSVIAPYMMTDTVGVNPAPNLTLALMAHRDPETLAWSESPLIEPPPAEPLPVSVPPWWRMSKKHAMFYNGMGRGDHARFMMMKSLVCADGLEDVKEIDRLFTDVRTFIASLEPPAYPYAVDEALAGRGQHIFESRCAACHGTYGPDGAYPNLVVDLETVGTDPAYALRAYEDSDRFMDWFNRSWYADGATARPAPGYIAPPLDGIWITAPFLHNGSVPTLAALLDSTVRPTWWTRDLEAPAFDRDAVGWAFTELDHGKDRAEDRESAKRIYDTTLPGYGNGGHRFGDDLDDGDRRAVIEYLKTL